MKEYAIIVAGGSGKRMNSNLPKQFITIAGKPILMHTIDAFLTYSDQIEIIIVLPDNQQDFWKKLCQQHSFTKSHQITSGGKSRFQSVKNGLSVIKDNDSLVAIHDGVRPLIKPSIIKDSFKSAESFGSGIVVTKLKESIREKSNGITLARNRDNYYLVQTPQTFRTNELKKAYQVEDNPNFTDDASVVEFMGGKISLVEGDYENLKITTPEDIIIAEAIMLNKKVS